MFSSIFVATAISSTANSLRSISTFMRCAARAPNGAATMLASAIHSSAGR